MVEITTEAVASKKDSKKQAETTIEIPMIKKESIRVTIVGTAPLIFHQFGEKAKRQIIDKQLKKAKQAREARDPEAEYRASYYYDATGAIALPAHNIKQAMVGATRFIEGIHMTQIRGAIFVRGDAQGFIPVQYESERMREDMVRLQGIGKPADVRFRGEVSGWRMTFWIEYNANMFTQAQVINLLNMAGFSQGLGEWRPERNGMFGTFEVGDVVERE